MKALPVFQPLPPSIDAEKLSVALKESGMACKVTRDGNSSVKLSPLSETTCPQAIRNFVAGFASGWLAF